jgi:hypothetical protein
MALVLRWGSVFEAEQPDALVLTIDGENTRAGGIVDSIGGSLAHRFAELWPEAWEEISRCLEERLVSRGAIRHGHAFPAVVEVASGCPFRLVVFASTLRHAGDLSVLRPLVSQGIASSLREAEGVPLVPQVRRLHAGLMKGGWRLSLRDALDGMLDGYRRYAAFGGQHEARGRALVDLHVHVALADERAEIERLARLRGLPLP